jgi:murein L,D-transpeptidase YafK
MREQMRTAFIVVVLAALLLSLPAQERADRILVLKKQRVLPLMRGDTVFRTYKVSLGGEPVGAKTCQGDHRTPEGGYVIDRRKPNSRFHRALHVSYPNEMDRKRAAAAGCAPGGDIMIHGLPNGYGWIGAAHRLKDWTDGCVAVTNQEIEEIWRLVPDGTPVEIRP